MNEINEKSKKEIKFVQNESKKLNEEFQDIIKEKEELKLKHEKLHNLTHGKFFKKK